jgi:type II secretion system protein I
MQAFTLMEVVIALAITSISLLALLRLHLFSTVLADTAELKSQALLLADGKIAEAMAEDYPNIGTTQGIVQHGGISFQWQREITDTYLSQFCNLNSDLPAKALRKISVNIKWKNGLADKYLNLFTYVANRTIK